MEDCDIEIIKEVFRSPSQSKEFSGKHFVDFAQTRPDSIEVAGWIFKVDHLRSKLNQDELDKLQLLMNPAVQSSAPLSERSDEYLVDRADGFEAGAADHSAPQSIRGSGMRVSFFDKNRPSSSVTTHGFFANSRLQKQYDELELMEDTISDIKFKSYN